MESEARQTGKRSEESRKTQGSENNMVEGHGPEDQHGRGETRHFPRSGYAISESNWRVKHAAIPSVPFPLSSAELQLTVSDDKG